MTKRLYMIHSRLYQILTLFLKVKMYLWDDAYGIVQCRNAMMQCHQILVDWARMHDTRNNIGMTWSNGKSPKFWARSSQSLNWKKSGTKAIWFKILLENVITTKSLHKEDSIVGCKIITRCIASRSPGANHYAQSSSITLNMKNPITTSIQTWLWAAVSKFKSGVVPSKILLRVEYQKGRGHPLLSNGYLLALILSTV
jgi:hypothetical protein